MGVTAKELYAAVLARNPKAMKVIPLPMVMAGITEPKVNGGDYIVHMRVKRDFVEAFQQGDSFAVVWIEREAAQAEIARSQILGPDGRVAN